MSEEVPVSEFVQRLNQLLSNQCRHEYVRFGDLAAFIRKALTPEGPPDTEFPRMLYKGRQQTRVAASRDEEARAVAEGFGRVPPPQYEEGYPRWYVERPKSEGGWKVWGNRRVTILTPQDEAKFRAVTEADDWIPDTVENPHGCRGIGLDTLTDERKEQLTRLLDAQLTTAPAREEAAPVEATEEVR